ncbi:MAG: hypothetical protein ACXVX5_08085, partial [Mycobacterium sp.]
LGNPTRESAVTQGEPGESQVLFTGLTSDEAHVSSYFTVVTQLGLDHFGRYRDTLVPAGDGWLIKRRKVSTDWAAPDSPMAGSPRGK